jgi:hypothetical protein
MSSGVDMRAKPGKWVLLLSVDLVALWLSSGMSAASIGGASTSTYADASMLLSTNDTSHLQLIYIIF